MENLLGYLWALLSFCVPHGSPPCMSGERDGIEHGPVVTTKPLLAADSFLSWAPCDPVAASCPLSVSQVTWVLFLFELVECPF